MGKWLGQETGLFLVYIQTKKDLKIKYTIYLPYHCEIYYYIIA